MKLFLLSVFLLLGISACSQYVVPVNIAVKRISAVGYYYDTRDSSLYLNMGTTYKAAKVLNYDHFYYVIDSLVSHLPIPPTPDLSAFLRSDRNDTINAKLGINTSGQYSFLYNYRGANSQGLNIFLNEGGSAVLGAAGNVQKGSNNVAIGFGSFPSATNAFQNAAVGSYSMYGVTTGNNNTAMGYCALFGLTTGLENVAIGVSAMQANSTSSSNTAVGFQSLVNLYSGYYDTGIGSGALYNCSGGQNNTSLGYNSLYNLSGGHYNIGIGSKSGYSIAAGGPNSAPHNSIFIGFDTRSALAYQTNQIVIGHSAIGKGSNTVTLGNASTTDQYHPGKLHTGALFLDALNAAPASASAAGVAGDIRITADYIYVCSATNTWVRSALVTW